MNISNPLFDLFQLSLAHVGCIFTPPDIVYISMVSDPIWLPIYSFHERFSLNIPPEYVFDLLINVYPLVKYQLLEGLFTLFQTFRPNV